MREGRSGREPGEETHMKSQTVLYHIFDPQGNVTALAETAVPEEAQASVGRQIMEAEPLVEQVGFLRFSGGDGEDPALRMAGGEFCGNAALSAAAFCFMAAGKQSADLKLRVSGLEETLSASLSRIDGKKCFGTLRMPRPDGIREETLILNGREERAVLVSFPGLSHAVLRREAPADRGKAEEEIRDNCARLGLSGLGFLYLTGEQLTPLVYIRTSDTLFWENACASGSAAVGYALLCEGGALPVRLKQPGGCIEVSAGPGGSVCLSEEICFIGSRRLAVKA